MSKSKPRQAAPAAVKTNITENAAASVQQTKGFVLPYPYLWLALAVVLLYYPTFSFGLTDLDDSIFIRDFREYNQDLHNLVVSFQRGLFDPIKDPYYRPLFMDSMILNFMASDDGQNIISYHVVNVLLHLTATLLVHKLFTKLGIRQLAAFVLTLLFAVHPVLTQAVAWIPGRNDTMLAVFIIAFLIQTIDYSETQKTGNLLLSALFLLLAFFTKETAAFAPVAALILLVLVLRKAWKDKAMLPQYAVWAGCFAVWYVARSLAATASSGIATTHALEDLAHRLPVILQYLGKIVLPVNLSVFPEQQDTVYYYGIAALVILAGVVYLNKQRDMRAVTGGILLFLLFLMPALLVPHELNKQTFEHRLYLPMIGILLILSQSVLLHNKLGDKQLLIAAVAVCGIMAAINLRHQKNFESPISFWTQAAETSSTSSFANMMLAARLGDKEFDRSSALIRKAYKLNPKEKYLNFYYGVMLQKKDSVLQSEPYLLVEKNGSGYFESDFYLARVAMERKDLKGAINYLETYLKRDSINQQANLNLLLLYLDTQQKDKAATQAKRMQGLHVPVPPQLLQQLGM